MKDKLVIYVHFMNMHSVNKLTLKLERILRSYGLTRSKNNTSICYNHDSADFLIDIDTMSYTRKFNSVNTIDLSNYNMINFYFNSIHTEYTEITNWLNKMNNIKKLDILLNE